MPDTQIPQQEPWQWSEEHWRTLVAQVRAGRCYLPKAWKDGARCAVALSFDSDHETNELRDGGQSIGRMAWGQSGNRVGVPRIRKLLERHGVKATFYVPAVAALLHPEFLYAACLEMAGELATFTAAQKRPAKFPPYKHDELQQSFAPVIGRCPYDARPMIVR